MRNAFKNRLRIKTVVKNVLIVLILMSCSGCIGSLPTKYYLLSSQSREVQSEETLKKTIEKKVLLKPITLVEYLKKDRIVTRKGAYEVDISDFHLWAEPLDKSISRVLIDNLNNNSQGILVDHFSYEKKEDADLSIKIKIEQFERSYLRKSNVVETEITQNDIVKLKSEVLFFDTNSKDIKLKKNYELEVQCIAQSLGAKILKAKTIEQSVTVECMSKALGLFSKELINEINNLHNAY